MSEVARLSRAELNTEFLQLQHGMTKIRNLGNRSVGAVPEQAAPGAEDYVCARNEAAFRKACKQFSACAVPSSKRWESSARSLPSTLERTQNATT